MFCGALHVGYADDVIIMAPTVTATKQMLNICADYGIEYNVLLYTSIKLPYFIMGCNRSI